MSIVVMKFGGRLLAERDGIEKCVHLMAQQRAEGKRPFVVISDENGAAEALHRAWSEKGYQGKLLSDPSVSTFVPDVVPILSAPPAISDQIAALWAVQAAAERVELYTHMDGIFTANPYLVVEAKKIAQLSYTEAAELAQYGADIFHYKTLDPLIEHGILLHIKNYNSPLGIHDHGTVVTTEAGATPLRALATLKGKALIQFEGHEMMGVVGLDARIFGALSRAEVSVAQITQGSSERGTGIVVDSDMADRAVVALHQEFATEIDQNLVRLPKAFPGLATVALIGVPLSEIDRPYAALVRHGITPRMINNAVPSDTLCLLIEEEEIPLALNVMHSELFDKERKIHIAVVGHGTVGGALLDQLVCQRDEIRKRQGLDLIPFAVANSRRVLLTTEGVGQDWRSQIADKAIESTTAVDEIIRFAKEKHLENLIFVDNTSSEAIPVKYKTLITAGFDLVSSNKVSNAQPIKGYRTLRDTLRRHRKSYRYETNVGAGLPLIDYLRLLHLSGDKITSIRGLFSGSLGFIFNALSEGRPFAEVLQEAVFKGFTEPDPRIDLSGIDVARKVLILARELDQAVELTDVEVDNLVPKPLRDKPLEELWEHLSLFEEGIKARGTLGKDEVLRYVGSLTMPTQEEPATLFCRLMILPRHSTFGQVTGADSCFEIYTENYGDLPIVIRGAGAGAEVTAQGVFSDILRTAESHTPPH